MEPALPGTVRLPGRDALRRPAGDRPAALERGTRRDGRGRRGSTGATPTGASARGRPACVRTRTHQRPGDRDGRPRIARRRLRHQLQRHHRIQAGRARTARGQRNPGATRGAAHPRGRVRAAEQDPLPGRDQPRCAAAAACRAPVCLGIARGRRPGGTGAAGGAHGRGAACGRGPAGRAAGRVAAGCRHAATAMERFRRRRIAAGTAGAVRAHRCPARHRPAGMGAGVAAGAQ